MIPKSLLSKNTLTVFSFFILLIGNNNLYANHKTQIAWFPGYTLTIQCPIDHTPFLIFSVWVTGGNMIDLPEDSEPGAVFNEYTDTTTTDIVSLNPDLDMRLHVFFRDFVYSTLGADYIGHANIDTPYDIRLHESANGQLFQTIAYRFRYFGLNRTRLFTAWPGWGLANDGNADATRFTTRFRKMACVPVGDPQQDFTHLYPTVANNQSKIH
jgi:hypothetical protein